jgi:hypothetical protein
MEVGQRRRSPSCDDVVSSIVSFTVAHFLFDSMKRRVAPRTGTRLNKKVWRASRRLTP